MEERFSIGRQKPLRFSEKQVKYLRTGEAPGTYSRQNIESQIKEQVNYLPQRVEFLLDDLELFRDAYPEVLSLETWREPWLRMMGLGENPPEEEIDQAYSFAFEDGSYPTSGLIQFGEQLGHIANNFHIPQNGDGLFEEKEHIVLGVVQAMCEDTNIQAEGVPGNERRRFVNDLIEELEAWRDGMAAVDDETAEEYIERKSKCKRNTEQARQKIRQTINSIDIDVEPKADVVLTRMQDSGVIPESQFDLTDYSVPADYRVEEELSEEDIITTVEEDQLAEKAKLMELIEAESERLHDEDVVIGKATRNEEGRPPDVNSKYQSTVTTEVPAVKLIKAIRRSDEDGLSSEDIVEELVKEEERRRELSVGTDLDITKSCELEMTPQQTERPLLKRRDRTWFLTPYGKALADFELRQDSHAWETPGDSDFDAVLEVALEER